MNTPLGWLTAFHTLISLVATIVGLWAIRDLMIGRYVGGESSQMIWQLTRKDWEARST